MGETINLRTARKAIVRMKKRQQANANAAQHGRTKGQRAADDRRARAVESYLDGHRRDGSGNGADGPDE